MLLLTPTRIQFDHTEFTDMGRAWFGIELPYGYVIVTVEGTPHEEEATGQLHVET